MDIYHLAMEMERDGKALYQDLSAKTSNASIKGVLDELIRMEDNHYHVFEAMATQSPVVGVQKISLASVTRVLKQIPEYFELENEIDSATQLYERALDLERENEGEYLRMAEHAASDIEKKQILAIAGEEHKHVRVLEQIIDFIQAPSHHPVNAEFNDNEDY